MHGEEDRWQVSVADGKADVQKHRGTSHSESVAQLSTPTDGQVSRLAEAKGELTREFELKVSCQGASPN